MKDGQRRLAALDRLDGRRRQCHHRDAVRTRSVQTGRNIYPKKIEDKLNNLPYVVEKHHRTAERKARGTHIPTLTMPLPTAQQRR